MKPRVFSLAELKATTPADRAIARITVEYVTNALWVARCRAKLASDAKLSTRAMDVFMATLCSPRTGLVFAHENVGSVAYAAPDGRLHYVGKEFVGLLDGLDVVRLEAPSRFRSAMTRRNSGTSGLDGETKCPIAGVDTTGAVAVFIAQRTVP